MHTFRFVTQIVFKRSVLQGQDFEKLVIFTAYQGLLY